MIKDYIMSSNIILIFLFLIIILLIYFLQNPKQEQFNYNFSEKQVTSLPNLSNIIEFIRENYLDSQYTFNLSNSRVTTRNINCDLKKHDRIILQKIMISIEQWAEIMKSPEPIIVDKINPLFIMYTDDEFYIRLNAKISYQDDVIYLKLSYYGNISDDKYILQLIEIDTVSRKNFEGEIC